MRVGNVLGSHSFFQFDLSVCGWKAVHNRLLIPRFFVVSVYNSEVNRLFQSVMIFLGIPGARTMCCMKSVANYCVFRFFLHSMKWLILIRQSMTTCIESYPFKFGKSEIKSIVIDCEGWSVLYLTAEGHIVHDGLLCSGGICRNF